MRISDWSSDVCSSDLFVGVGRQAAQGPVDVFQRLGRFQEKIAAQAHVGKLAAFDLEVDDHQFAARDFVFAMHGDGTPDQAASSSFMPSWVAANPSDS